MSHQLQLEVPDEIYQSLAEAAQATGQPVEELAVKWLASANKRLGTDPLDKWIGAIRSDNTTRDWIDKHDEYLGRAAADTHEEESSGG